MDIKGKSVENVFIVTIKCKSRFRLWQNTNKGEGVSAYTHIRGRGRGPWTCTWT